jgi:hypothetical protein
LDFLESSGSGTDNLAFCTGCMGLDLIFADTLWIRRFFIAGVFRGVIEVSRES